MVGRRGSAPKTTNTCSMGYGRQAGKADRSLYRPQRWSIVPRTVHLLGLANGSHRHSRIVLDLPQPHRPFRWFQDHRHPVTQFADNLVCQHMELSTCPARSSENRHQRSGEWRARHCSTSIMGCEVHASLCRGLGSGQGVNDPAEGKSWAGFAFRFAVIGYDDYFCPFALSINFPTVSLN